MLVMAGDGSVRWGRDGRLLSVTQAGCRSCLACWRVDDLSALWLERRVIAALQTDHSRALLPVAVAPRESGWDMQPAVL